MACIYPLNNHKMFQERRDKTDLLYKYTSWKKHLAFFDPVQIWHNIKGSADIYTGS